MRQIFNHGIDFISKWTRQDTAVMPETGLSRYHDCFRECHNLIPQFVTLLAELDMEKEVSKGARKCDI